MVEECYVAQAEKTGGDAGEANAETLAPGTKPKFVICECVFNHSIRGISVRIRFGTNKGAGVRQSSSGRAFGHP